MKLTAISDTHGLLMDNLPGGDVLCIAGDISPLKAQYNMPQMLSWLKKKFNKWVDEIPYETIVLVAGNHDFVFERFQDLEEILHRKVVYLNNSQATLYGKKFYGSPNVIGPNGWAFYDPKLKDLKATFPKDVDVAVFHQPLMANHNGSVLFEHPWKVTQEELYSTPALDTGYKSYGSSILDSLVLDMSPKWVITGHVHSGNHLPSKFGNSNIVNVSINDETYCPTYKPFEFEI